MSLNTHSCILLRFLFAVCIASLKPTIRGVGNVPERNNLSCPPPSIKGESFTLGFFLIGLRIL